MYDDDLHNWKSQKCFETISCKDNETNKVSCITKSGITVQTGYAIDGCAGCPYRRGVD